MSDCKNNHCIFCVDGHGHPNPPPMDDIDYAQQEQIEQLQSNGRFMFILLIINTLASIAQILECWKIWHLK